MRAIALSSTRISAVDTLRSDHASVLTQVLGIVGFAVLAALGAQFRIYLWEIPITFQTLAIYGSGLFLGARNGLFSMGLYLLAGMFFPVFASEAFGPAYLFGAASAGFLLAAPIVAALVGSLSTRWNTLPGSALALLAGSLVLFSFGVTWLYAFAGGELSFFQAVERGWLRFAIWDLAKIGIVAAAYVGARRLTSRG